MGRSYLVALLLTLVVASTYWYQSTSYMCPIPVSYRLGDIDESFSISREEALLSINEAVTLWEDMAGQNLFQYDERANLTVSFLFDERQANANAQQSDEARLDAARAQNDEIRDRIDRLQNSYDDLEQAFIARKAAYDTSLQTYNDAVRQANDRGGATPEEFQALSKTQAELDRESNALRADATELNTLAEQLNQLSTEGNRLIRSYNIEVDQYNDQYTGGEEFTQGDYTGDAIRIYKFSNENELVTVLAHEFGHALGIDHIEESGSIMYYLLEEGDETVPVLTAADRAAFAATCQPDTWDFQLRSLIRSIIS